MVALPKLDESNISWYSLFKAFSFYTKIYISVTAMISVDGIYLILKPCLVN